MAHSEPNGGPGPWSRPWALNLRSSAPGGSDARGRDAEREDRRGRRCPIPCPAPARCWCGRSPAASAAPTSTRSSTPSAMVEARRARRARRLRDGPARDIVMGHEFCAEILDFGPGTLTPPAGRPARLLDADRARTRGGLAAVGYSNDFPGGYGERMLLSEPLLLPVPGRARRRSTRRSPSRWRSARTRSRRAASTKGDAALVVGCGPGGPRGDRGAAPPRASGRSSPPTSRRSGAALAEKLGADVVVDPAQREADARPAQKAAGGAAGADLRVRRRPGHDRAT